MKEIKSSEEWAEIHKDAIRILDPDGWDRRAEHWEMSWNELITEKEFWRRAGLSTCQFKKPWDELLKIQELAY